MQMTVQCKAPIPRPPLRQLALMALMLLSGLLAQAQAISLSLKKVPMETAFQAIEKQSVYRFIYSAEVLKQTAPVTLELTSSNIETVLNRLLQNQPLSFTLNKNYISIRRRELPGNSTPPIVMATVQGRVRNDQGEPLANATVSVMGTATRAATDSNGLYTLRGLAPDAVLVVTSVGHYGKQVTVGGQTVIDLVLPIKTSTLDETVVIGYGITTKRLQTGSVSRLTAAEIAKQPVTNAAAAMQGRMAGVTIVQANGLPGSNFNVQVRGQNSLRQGTQPLYIVDGVPLMLNSNTLAQVSPFISSNVNSPLNAINPSDIESIEVLKDADATAIYGAQGANGVVLITTKKGGSGKTALSVNAYTGYGRVGRTMQLLDTKQYLQMRREAFANDGATPSAANAPDLVLWDTARYTDWTKELIGGVSQVSNIQATLSGGTPAAKILFSTNYATEKTVFPEQAPARRGSMRLHAGHTGADKKFKADITAMYTLEEKRLPNSDLTGFITLAPNAPAMKDSAGNLVWTAGIENPYANNRQEYRGQNRSFLANTLLQYELLNGFTLRSSFGLTHLSNQEESRIPISAQRPSATARGTMQLGAAALNSWIIEPQANYHSVFGGHGLDLLGGLSLQSRDQSGHTLTGTQYTNDDLLGNITAAGQVSATNYASRYRYAAGFGRITYNYRNRYVLNLNARRDGSSRFGPADRFSNFGAVGAAWVLTEQRWLKDRFRWLQFAKVRGSYGVTGNDQIGDYMYLDAWTTSPNYQYGGQSGSLPNRLFNPYYQWERNKKLELAMDLSLFRSRLQLTGAWYRNRSDNQLVNYKLPTQTGFASILKNLDALLQNSGLELELTSTNMRSSRFSWKTAANISFPRNKLLRYPGLEYSSDRLSFAIGQPLALMYGYGYEGVDPQTGLYTFTDINKDNLLNVAGDYRVLGATTINFHGGLQNTFKYGPWEADLFFHFVQQQGRSYLTNLSNRPGFIGNQPVEVMGRWQKPGDNSPIQRFTQSAANPAFLNYRNSSAVLTDASFIRLKNLSVSYSMPARGLKKMKLEGLRFFMEGRNLLTFTAYKGADPETQNLYSLPPLRCLVGGISFNL